MKKYLPLLLLVLIIIPGVNAAVTKYEWTDGLYTVVKFNGTGTYEYAIPSGVYSIQSLIVGGGGQGGNTHSGGYGCGGGGAGGVVANASIGVIPSDTFTITVGAGGSGNSTDQQGNDGNLSKIQNTSFGITALKGGGGGGHSAAAGRNGGSGGGASNGGAIGSGTSGQGNNGGIGNPNYPYGGGSGGGAGAAGTNTPTGQNGVPGGVGVSNSITGTSVYYGGGGGAGVDYTTYTGGAGGNGGGGQGGGYNQAPVAGTNDLGGGGGGAGMGGFIGGTGGDGVVILRFLTYTPNPPVASFSGTPTSGAAPLEVVFSGSGTYSPTSWYWEFGDGYIEIIQNPTHTYNNTGVFSVNFSATNTDGTDFENKTNYITVSEATPTPTPTPTPPASGSCYNQSGIIPVYLETATQESLFWSWDLPSNITNVSVDFVYYDFDTWSPYFNLSGFQPGTWHRIKIMNGTGYGILNCTTNGIPWTPSLDINPTTEVYNTNKSFLSFFVENWIWILVIIIGGIVVVQKW